MKRFSILWEWKIGFEIDNFECIWNQKKSACFNWSKPPKFPSPGDQTGVFQGMGDFLKYGHFDKHFSYNKLTKDSTEKKMEFT